MSDIKEFLSQQPGRFPLLPFSKRDINLLLALLELKESGYGSLDEGSKKLFQNVIDAGNIKERHMSFWLPVCYYVVGEMPFDKLLRKTGITNKELQMLLDFMKCEPKALKKRLENWDVQNEISAIGEWIDKKQYWGDYE